MAKNKKMYAKLLFLVMCGAVSVIALIISLTGNATKELAPEEEQTQVSVEIDEAETKALEEIEATYKEEAAQDNVKKEAEKKPQTPEGAGSLETIKGEALDEFDYKNIIKKRIGAEAYEDIMVRADKAMQLFTTKQTTGWEDVASQSFQQHVAEGKVTLLDTKSPTINIFPTQQVNELDVIIGAIVDDGKQVKSYSLIFMQEQERYVLDDVVLMWGN